MKKVFLVLLIIGLQINAQNRNFVIDNSFPSIVNEQSLGRATIGGDTIFISSNRTNPIKFQFTNGSATKPLVVINKGGQVKIDSKNGYSWGAIIFENCKYIKISGSGHPNYKYGFLLSADDCGLAFSELSSDCEAEFIKISHYGFFGFMVKKNYEGNPPFPYPVFENLSIHDCFVENVSEGMYLGETKSPGMEFKHVKIYNNIVRNTFRESMQIANMVEDVEIHNNTLLNAGLGNIPYQTSVLQIGDNSVVNAYNNILIKAPATGIAVYGKGNCNFTNNYLASNMGIFIDNRLFSDNLTPMNITHNFFSEITGNQIIKNYNEINYFTVSDNNYNTNKTFFLNQSGNQTNFTTSNNNLTSIPAIEFTNPETNDYSLTSNNPIAYKNMGAPGGPEYFQTVPKQIVIKPEMILDLVPGGSVNSPLFLFDEQNVDYKSAVHPTSLSWKPDYAMNKTSYHVIVDLGKEYHISEINLHDMHDTYGFTVEYGNDQNWAPLFTDPCNTFNKWSSHKTDVSTQYLRLSMNENVFAAVNEIIITGYPVTKEASQIVISPNMISDKVKGGSVYSPLLMFDEQNLNINNGEHAISNSWKPYYTNANAPYYVEIDLGREYHISEINLHDMNASYDFTVEYGKPTQWIPLFVDPLSMYKFWNKHNTDISTRYLRLSMQNSPYAAVNEIIIYGYPIINPLEIGKNEIIDDNHILITNNMVTDLVQGGSINTPQFLFDEQNLDLQSGLHPISNSWKPDYIMNKTSYHALVDLGKEYNISKINLHDMNDQSDFTVEYGDGTNWSTLFVDPCTTYNKWSENVTSISTRYLRFSMYKNVTAYVNEVYIYGTPTASTAKIAANAKYKITTNNVYPIIENIALYPNPVDQKLTINLPTDMLGKNNVVITDISGKIIYVRDYSISKESPFIEVTSVQLPTTTGVYTISIQHESGAIKVLKFLKK